MNKNKEFKISISNIQRNNQAKFEVCGTRLGLMIGLTNLIHGLKEETNLTKRDIEECVRIGLKNNDEIKDEANRKLDELIKKLTTFTEFMD